MPARRMSRTARNSMIFASVAVAAIVLDQAAKALVVARVDPGQSITLIPGVLELTHSTNTGAAFGILKGNSQLVVLGALLVVALTVAWFYAFRFRRSFASFLGLGLIIGGAAGNLIDRVTRHKVVDFLDLGWWPVFNFADVAIVVGVIIVMIASFREILDGEAADRKESGGSTVAS